MGISPRSANFAGWKLNTFYDMKKILICGAALLALCAATVSCNASFPEFRVKDGDFDSERLSADSARLVFEGALTSAGINFSKITVFTDKTEDGGINIIEVYVYTDASSEAVAAVIGSGSYKLVVVNG